MDHLKESTEEKKKFPQDLSKTKILMTFHSSFSGSDIAINYLIFHRPLSCDNGSIGYEKAAE